eukprot:9471755-Pyramimonas_sp.AAC.1
MYRRCEHWRARPGGRTCNKPNISVDDFTSLSSRRGARSMVVVNHKSRELLPLQRPAKLRDGCDQHAVTA